MTFETKYSMVLCTSISFPFFLAITHRHLCDSRTARSAHRRRFYEVEKANRSSRRGRVKTVNQQTEWKKAPEKPRGNSTFLVLFPEDVFFGRRRSPSRQRKVFAPARAFRPFLPLKQETQYGAFTRREGRKRVKDREYLLRIPDQVSLSV